MKPPAGSTPTRWVLMLMLMLLLLLLLGQVASEDLWPAGTIARVLLLTCARHMAGRRNTVHPTARRWAAHVCAGRKACCRPGLAR